MSELEPSRWRETPQVLHCGWERLVGMLCEPAESPGSRVGVVVVVGGPQYRVGSHRQFVQWARALASAGFPCLRFDVRGMGDSDGTSRTFLEMSDDIAAAVEHMASSGRGSDGVVLAALCDGASASLLYLHDRHDSRVVGLILLNPWVRTAQSQAKTQVKHYYLRRLRDRSFWAKLLRGQVALSALGELSSTLAGAARSRGAASDGPSGNPETYPSRMASALLVRERPLLLVLSGQDYTANEFLDRCGSDPLWQRVLATSCTRRMDLPNADHTFSRAADRLAVQEASVQWLQALSTTRARSPA